MTRAGVICIKFAPSYRSLPQVGKSDGNPSPRKLNADSVIIALAIPRVAETIIGLNTLGKICLEIIRREGAPILWAATTNSCSLSVSTSPRTIRAVCIQLVIPITNTISIKIPVSGPKAARKVSLNNIIITSKSGSSGRAKNKSVKRIKGPSRRLKKPANTPIAVPTNNDNNIATTPTNNDTLPPAITCASVSRPRLSVPIGCSHEGLRFLFRISRYCGSMVWI